MISKFGAETCLGGSGIAIFSRIPGRSVEFDPFAFPAQPALVATISEGESNSRPAIRIVGLHTLSPLPLRRTCIRDAQFESLMSWSRGQSLPLCVCGDFNTNPWPKPFRQLLQVGFVDSRVGAGNCASWPAGFGPFSIPIDQALSLGECTITDRQVLSTASGSDHRPISFTLHY